MAIAPVSFNSGANVAGVTFEIADPVGQVLLHDPLYAADNTYYQAQSDGIEFSVFGLDGLVYKLNDDVTKIAMGGTGNVAASIEPSSDANDFDWAPVSTDLADIDSQNAAKSTIPALLESHLAAATAGVKTKIWVHSINPESVPNGELTSNYYIVADVSNGVTSAPKWVEMV